MTASTGEQKPHSLLRPRIAIPFLLVAAIWGSTWWVITGQIDTVPASWSIAWRFMLATPAMFAVALLAGKSPRLERSAHLLAASVGLFQICFNFNFVYLAELHLTSGIMAVIFSLIFVPNALMARAFLGEPVTRRFLLGSVIATAGIAMLLAHEWRLSPLGGDVPWGIFLGATGVFAASVANIIQASRLGKGLPMASMLAWAMLYGTIINIAWAWLSEGVPIIPTDARFWLGLAYLALAGSVVTFPLYYGLVREIGAGRAAYNGVAVVIIAMCISTVVEGYQWSALAIGGAILSLVGLVIAMRARSV